MGVAEADHGCSGDRPRVLVEKGRLGVQFDGVGAHGVANPGGAGDRDIVGAVSGGYPTQRVADAVAGLFHPREGGLNGDLHTFGSPQVHLNGVFHSPLCLEGEKVVVVSAVNGVGQIGLIAPGTDRALVYVSSGYLSGAAAFVGVAVQESGVLESTEGVTAQIERTVEAIDGARHFHIIGVGGPGNPGDGLLAAGHGEFLLG